MNQGGNNVSVMNASSLTTAKWVTVGSSPQQAAYDPLDHAMFVSVSAGHVSIINDTNLTVTAVPLPQTSGGGSGDPTGLVYDPANGSVLVSEYNLGRLAVLNASTGAYEMLVKTLAYPGYLAYDGANGGVYVLNWFGDSLNILNSTLASVSNGSASATAPPVYDPADGWMLVAAGGVERFNASSDVRISRLLPSQQAPWGMAYDATNSSVFVVGSSGPSSNAGVVSAWNSSTGAFEGSLGFNETNEPVDAAYDSGTAEVYVSDQGSSWIAAWNATYPYALVNQTYVGENPTGMAVDPRRDRLVVAEVQSKNVEVLTASNLSVVANVTVGWNPTDVVYVPITDQYYVADSGSNNLSIINASTLNVITNVSVGGCPFDETYDSASQTVLVTDSCTNSVTAVNVTTHAARSVPVGGSPEGVAFDSVTGGIYVANLYSNNVTVFNASSLSVVNNITVDGGPSDVTVNPTSGRVYAADSNDDTLGFIDPCPTPSCLSITSFQAAPASFLVRGGTNLTTELDYAVGKPTYAYTGLPPGCASANRSVLFCRPTTSGNFTVEVNVSDQTGKTVHANLTLSVERVYYAATFSETGLPAGTNWSVDLNGTVESSLTSSLGFREPAERIPTPSERLADTLRRRNLGTSRSTPRARLW